MTTAETRRADKLADLMADGCPSFAEAAYRMRRTIGEVETLWSGICRELGRQAR